MGSSDRTDKPPFPETGWKSAKRLACEGFVGGYKAFVKKFVEVKTKLIADIVDSGFSEVEAKKIVDRNLIGIRNRITGVATYASPTALSLMDLIHKGDVRHPEKHWRSGSQLKAEFVGGNLAITAKLKQFQSNLFADLAASGMADEQSEAIIDNHLIGVRKPNSGPATEYASPDAIAMMTDEKILVRRSGYLSEIKKSR